MIENPNAPYTKHVNARILLRSEIEEAQRHTNSNKGAARWLNVAYPTYRRYAKLYDLFDRHLNVNGIGVEKGFAKRPTSVPLRDILAGKHPKYSLAKLKNRLIARNKLMEVCSICGFDERRITDKRVPLMLTFADGNHANFNLSNLELRCYNCMFLTTGAPSVVNRNAIPKSFTHPENIPATKSLPIKPTDYYERVDEPEIDILLTDEEKEALLQQIS
jgi:hypothetical protein